jgi:hypothetical protein
MDKMIDFYPVVLSSCQNSSLLSDLRLSASFYPRHPRPITPLLPRQQVCEQVADFLVGEVIE